MGVEFFKSLNSGILGKLIENPNCPREAFDALYEMNNFDLLARCPNTPQDILREMYNYFLKENIMKPSFLELLSNPNLSDDIFAKVYMEFFPYKKISTSIDRKDSEDIYTALAKNSSAPDYILRQLYKENMFRINNVWEKLATNPKTPLDLLEIISKRGIELKALVLSNPSIKPDLNKDNIYSLYYYIIKAFALNPNTSKEVLELIVEEYSNKTITNVFRNPSCPFEIIEKYCKNNYYILEQHSDITRAIVKNPNVPFDFLAKLYNLNIFKNEIIDQVIKRHPDIDSIIKTLYYILGSKKLLFRYYANNPSVIITSLLNEESESVRNECFTSNALIAHDEKYLKSFNIETNNPFNYGMAFYIIFAKKYLNIIQSNNYLSSKTGNNYSNCVKEFVSKIDEEILSDIIPEELLYYFHSYPSFTQVLSYDSIKKINEVYKNTKNNNDQKNHYLSKIKVYFLNALERYDSSNGIINIKSYIDKTDVFLGDEYAKKTDLSSKQNGKDKIQFIITLKSSSKIENKNIIKAGYFPQKKVSSGDKLLLDYLEEMGLIRPGKKHFTNFNTLTYKPLYIYEVNGREFIKYEKDWIEVLPIEWKVNHNNCTLTPINVLWSANDINYSKMAELFYHEAFEQYEKNIDLNERKELNKEITENNLFKTLQEKNLNKIENEKQKEKERQELEELTIKIIESEKMLNELRAKKAELENKPKEKVGKREDVPDDILFVDKGDYLEFNPRLKKYLYGINLFSHSCKNLKIRGLDLSNTNINLDPQEVYGRDLRDCILDGSRLTIDTVFDNCDLRGAKIIGKTDATRFTNAIIDENTVLPEGIDTSVMIIEYTDNQVKL